VPSFEWPWVFWLLPLPYLVHRFLPAYQARGSALRVPFLPRLESLLGERALRSARTRSLLRLMALSACWLLTVGALARPVLHGARVERQTAARDLLLVVDLSGSMAATDLTPAGAAPRSRLDVVKSVVRSFIAERAGDRLGLVVFGAAPYVQVPFTLDTRVVQQLLDETDVGMAGPATALGDAVGLSLSLLARSDAKSRVVIVLTDGNDTGSSVPPLQAARIAAARGVTLYTIGVGDPRAAGEQALNTSVLERMAELTQGRYIFAGDADSLAGAYRVLDSLEPVAQRTASYQPRRSVSHYPLAGVVALLCLSALARSAAWVVAALGRWRGRRAAGATLAAGNT
jgi:Ca-activated chloride channel family protein